MHMHMHMHMRGGQTNTHTHLLVQAPAQGDCHRGSSRHRCSARGPPASQPRPLCCVLRVLPAPPAHTAAAVQDRSTRCVAAPSVGLPTRGLVCVWRPQWRTSRSMQRPCCTHVSSTSTGATSNTHSGVWYSKPTAAGTRVPASSTTSDTSASGCDAMRRCRAPLVRDSSCSSVVSLCACVRARVRACACVVATATAVPPVTAPSDTNTRQQAPAGACTDGHASRRRRGAPRQRTCLAMSTGTRRRRHVRGPTRAPPPPAATHKARASTTRCCGWRWQQWPQPARRHCRTARCRCRRGRRRRRRRCPGRRPRQRMHRQLLRLRHARCCTRNQQGRCRCVLLPPAAAAAASPLSVQARAHPCGRMQLPPTRSPACPDSSRHP
jgi:hypothetical protein